MSISKSRLNALREVMKSLHIQAYIIPTEDAHQSEYIADSDERRCFISGFTGSAGTAVVTLNEAALWTDGRYYLQASKELSPDWILQKFGLSTTPTKEDWLLKVLPEKSFVAIDPQLFTINAAQTLEKKLTEAGHYFKPIQENLVDKIWETRPKEPCNPVMILDTKYSGLAYQEKIKNIQAFLEDKKYWGLVVSALDEVAWLFNLRGSDIAFNPVFHSYALITPSMAYLYVDESKLDNKVTEYLSNVVIVKKYRDIFTDLQEMGKSASSEKKLLFDQRCSLALLSSLGQDKPHHVSKSPIQLSKAIKNDVELEGFRQCHMRDASALCRYFAWLEGELVEKGNTGLTEAAAADQLEKLRGQLDGFKGLSFDTISSTGPNGAIIHYKPEHGTCAVIRVDQMYLCDSGGQYLDGTTDVTRTLHFGTPTAEEKDAFTRVLQGHIQLDMAVFPKGTTGFTLDILARAPLWKAGLDFRHGTGHGVGSFLNVHEGPQSISFRLSSNETAMQPGMTITNEPGYYKDGAYGIRIENVMLVKKEDTPNRFGDVDYYSFEHVTLVPIQTKLIDVELLTKQEKEWINKYHAKCFEKVSPLLKADEPGYKWLYRETRPI